MPRQLGDATVSDVEPHPEWAVEFDRNPGWTPATAAEADWLMRKAAGLTAGIAEVTRYVEAEIAALRYHLELETAADREDAARATALVEGWARAQELPPERTTMERKSLYGKVTRRRLEPRVTVEDEAEVLAWCRGAGVVEAIKVTPDALAWGELKKRVRITEDGVTSLDTGERVPGLAVAAQADKVTVSTAGAAEAP